jgi:hypothetical protein
VDNQARVRLPSAEDAPYFRERLIFEVAEVECDAVSHRESTQRYRQLSVTQHPLYFVERV